MWTDILFVLSLLPITMLSSASLANDAYNSNPSQSTATEETHRLLIEPQPQPQPEPEPEPEPQPEPQPQPQPQPQQPLSLYIPIRIPAPITPSTGHSRSYSQESVVSTQSSPPPYELYPQANSISGRIYNWLRKIPRFATHQAIYLPTLPTHRSFRSFRSDAPSITSTDSIVSSRLGPCLYDRIYQLFPERLILPRPLARIRTLLLCVSFCFLFLFSSLLFCTLFFSPETLPPPVVPDKTAFGTASFLTLNIFMRPPGIQNNWSDYKDDRLDYIVRFLLPKYDVIAFQESFAFGTRRKDRLIREARALGFNHHVESERHYPWEVAVDGGLLLLSRFPIVSSDMIEYPRGSHSDWLARKGALHALVQLNLSTRLHVYTTHAQASYEPGNQGDRRIRMSQFAALHQLMSTTAKEEGAPVLVMGDFNVDATQHTPMPAPPQQNEYKMMMSVLEGHGIESRFGRMYADPDWLLTLQDIIYQYYQSHVVTLGDTIKVNGEYVPAETVLTDSNDLMTMESLDRMLWDSRDSSLTVKSVQLEKFLVSENKALNDEEKRALPFTQISDHYGLSCVLSLV
ncbi:Endonuclease/exonuclease/phosphatase [Spinellus fusiger]|nr:Endonuclease/exonuclease/phosphatase [Spinellus fusiger]